MEICPDEQDREGEIHPATLVPGLRREEPEESHVERERDHLGADGPSPGRSQDDRKEDQHDRDRPCAEAAGGDSGNDERADHDEGVEEYDQREPTERMSAVEQELRPPLLIDPRRASDRERERIGSKNRMEVPHELACAYLICKVLGLHQRQQHSSSWNQERDEEPRIRC